MPALVRWGRRALLLLAVWAVLAPGTAAWARRYPITKSDATGSWIGLKNGLLHGRGELWTRYDEKNGLPAARVGDVELSDRSVWVATPRGLARLDKGSRRWETYTTPDLPGADVRGVSVDASDPDHVWVATTSGLAHFDVRKNAWQRFGTAQGLPSARVYDVLFRGRTVWAATAAGLAAYDLRTGIFEVFSEKDGLAAGPVLEIEEQGSDLWLFCGGGLSRMNLQRRTFSRFGPKEGLPGSEVLSWAQVQTLIYIVTDGGLITYDTAADALAPFLHKEGLQGQKVHSVASAGGFVWFATDAGLQRFEPTRKTWEYYRVEDGLSTDDLRRITVAGNLLLVVGAGGLADTYDYKKDEWMERSGLLPGPEEELPDDEGAGDGAEQGGDAAGQGAGAGEGEGAEGAAGAAPKQPVDEPLQLSFSAELDTELKQDLRWPLGGEFERGDSFWLVNTLRLGAGARWGKGRSIDFSGNIDWGDIDPLFEGDASTLASLQRYDLRLRYLGARDDHLREVIASDELRLEYEGGRLTERTELEGGRAVVDLGPRVGGRRAVTVSAAGGVRRGTPLRVVFRRPGVDALQIKRFKLEKRAPDGSVSGVRYVIPSSVRALLDGEELERNVDYFVDHENGVLWLKNTDLVHALRVLEVELEYEQIPRKNVGVVSMTDLVPRDGDIGQIKRAGTARWAKDEQGLFDEIDGGAEQYINRGWQQTLSQDLEWGSAGIILRVHDMGDEDNARAIFLARKLPDAKPVPGMTDVFLEKQAASLAVKLTRGAYFIEISLDQPSMEQEILSLADWLVSKLSASGGTSADALRDITATAGLLLRVGPGTHFGFDYLGTRSLPDAELERTPGVQRLRRDIFASYARHRRTLARGVTLSADVQAAASTSAVDGDPRQSGAAVRGGALLTSPLLNVRADLRKYTREYTGIGVARQTEFCRHPTGQCLGPGQSRLDYEVGLSSRLSALSWLPLRLSWQRQATALGTDYADAPADRPRTGIRDVALAELALERKDLPRLSLEGGYIGREDALAQQRQLRLGGTVEADLATGLLQALEFKKLFVRGLYQYGHNAVDEFRAAGAAELDRGEAMHHAVAELRLAPTLTESGYVLLEYHDLRGTLDAGGRLAERLTYWRLDAGAGSSVVPGLAARMESTFWFGDELALPLRGVASSSATTARTSLSTADLADQRAQESDARVSGVLDIFPGEWTSTLSPLKLNLAYAYTRQLAVARQRRGVAPLGEERCELVGDEDGDGLADCADPDCALADVCLQRTGETVTHRGYGTIYWDTPGKVQVELFGDVQRTISDRSRLVRAEREELRSYVTWRPIYPSPVTLRFDMVREAKRPQQYDGVSPEVLPTTWRFEPALEWRRRWSARWWHLAKLSVSYATVRDLPHIRTVEDRYGLKGDLERLDFDTVTVTPSVEIRRRIEDPAGRWSLRPYLRGSYKLQFGRGVASRIDSRVCGPDDPCLADGSETSRLLALSLGLIWVHGDTLFVDLDLATGWYDCDRAPAGSTCNDRVTFTPHLLATVRY